MATPIADCDTPNERAYRASAGTIPPKPSWLTAISTHIQRRMRSKRDRGIAATALELGSCWSMRNSNTGSRASKYAGTIEILFIRAPSGPVDRWARQSSLASRQPGDDRSARGEILRARQRRRRAKQPPAADDRPLADVKTT